jgi:hypothetical protein
MLSALEGAFVLARAQRSTEPLAVAGELMAAAVREVVGDRGGEPRKPRLTARWPSGAV